MNLKELIYPVRVYWDLCPLPQNSIIDYSKLCGEIIDIKALTLDLYVTEDESVNICSSILERVRCENIAIHLTASASVLSNPFVELLCNPHVRTILIEVSSFDEMCSVVREIKEYNNVLPLGVSFSVNRDSFMEIPDVLSVCIKNGIRRFVIPIQRPAPGEGCFYVHESTQEKLALELSRINYQSMNITVHDPFLWRIFYPQVRYPEGGCQAANSIIYISPDAEVYPCPLMPISLGRIAETPLREILMSNLKKELRKDIMNPPEACVGCVELRQCMGGCRGRAYIFTHSFEKQDPACMMKKRGH